MKIAILGATGHIARSLTPYFQKDGHDLYLFSRKENYLQYENFKKYRYDMILNCVGIGTYSNIKNYLDYFNVIEYYDNLILEQLKRNPYAVYINFSSGVLDSFKPEISQANCFAIAKLNSEAKHRAFVYSGKHDLPVNYKLEITANIIDIRLYSYFSRYINVNDDYFMCQIIKHIKENKILETSADNMIRDYIHTEDLYNAIKNQTGNKSVTIGSKKPTSKYDILNYFRYNGLRFKFKDVKNPSATGDKIKYYPEKIENDPKHTSLETIISETEHLLS
jgi:hypothetical protein